jgi:hypothetical protein
MMLDSPVNNFCTLNPLVKPSGTNTFAEGNLKVTSSSSWNTILGTQSISSGKWYWEATMESTNFKTGVMPDNVPASMTNPHTAYGILYLADGTKQIDGTATSYGATWAGGDIIGYAVDMDASTIIFYKNNASQGSISFSGTVANAASAIPGGVSLSDYSYWNFGQDSSFAGTETAQGNQDDNDKGDFYYTPPTGFLALCTDNLSDPLIALPGEYFNTVIWTGDDADDREITGVGFQPDLTWNKRRSTTGQHQLQDSLRGPTKVLKSSSSTSEGTETNSTKSFDSDGFTVGTDNNINGSGITYVAWNWKAGGTPTADNSAGAGNTPTAGSVKINGANLGSALAGTIPATKLSANTTSGFSIVKYEGNDTSAQTIGHGLSAAPELVIVKNIDVSEHWAVGSSAMASWSYYMYLNDTRAETSDANKFGATPSASVFTVGDAANTNENTLIAYCFHSVEGYSKVGSYAGNSSSTEGTFVYCGFKPAYVLNKMIEPHAYGWPIEDSARDPYNPAGYQLYAQSSGAEDANHPRLDFLSNGFKWYDASYNVNHSSATYLFLAFAESPFKYSNAR